MRSLRGSGGREVGMVQTPEHLEFGNPDHIRAVRRYEEEQARREAGLGCWVVGYETEEEARSLVTTGKVPIEVDPGGFDKLNVAYVRPAEVEPAVPEPPTAQQLRFSGLARLSGPLGRKR